MKNNASFRAITLIGMVFIILSLSIVSATQTSMGVYEKGSCVELIQLCGDCTYNNITSIIYPNATKIILDVAMTKRGSEFNYTYCFPDMNGDYLINGVGDLSGTATVWAYTIILTPNGDTPTTSKMMFNFGFIFILAIFLVLAIVGIFKIENYIGRFTLYWVAHILVIALSFMIWTGAEALLTTAPFIVGFFKIVFYFVMIGAFPMIILSLAWIFHIHLVNDDIKKMMDRGIDEDEAYDRASKKRRRR